jgi:hypothetical protein
LGTVSISLPTDGTTADVADYNTPIQTIVDEINGGLDNDNIAPGAAIAGSKLADNSVNLGEKASDWDGWLEVTDSWVYASATTVTVPTDATTKYSVGDKVKFTQTSVKYFYVTAVGATTLTLNGGSDYTVANAAISAVSYSKASTPLGFPQWFNYSPTVAGFSANPTSTVNRFSITGRMVTASIYQPTGTPGTSNATTFTITAPVTSANNGLVYGAILWQMMDNSANVATQGRAYILPNSGTFTLGKTANSDSNWTNSGTKEASFTISYEI